MRLLKTATLTLCEFNDEYRVGYAILSHRWFEAELSHQDLSLLRLDSDKQRSYCKIRDFCAVAREQGFEWAWVDTVCIDKRSSAELQESINSERTPPPLLRLPCSHSADELEVCIAGTRRLAFA